MTTDEARFDNTYFDSSGKQILVGDLLKVFHFKVRNRNYYMYHVVVMEETETTPVMALREYYNNKPHCRLYGVTMNTDRVYRDAKIICEKDWKLKRQRRKL